MQILITGAAGFIGFNLARHLLNNKKIKIFGIDNINNYYSQSLKKKDLRSLKNLEISHLKKLILQIRII